MFNIKPFENFSPFSCYAYKKNPCLIHSSREATSLSPYMTSFVHVRMLNSFSPLKFLFPHCSIWVGPSFVNEPSKIDLSKNAEFKAVKIPQLVPSLWCGDFKLTHSISHISKSDYFARFALTGAVAVLWIQWEYTLQLRWKGQAYQVIIIFVYYIKNMLTAGEQILQQRLMFCYEVWRAVKLVSARRL